MSTTQFDPSFSSLPDTLPIFPLPGVLLLPRGRLPLNIFEPRYLAMAEDALRTNRLIGMIQPSDATLDPSPIFMTGCAGRIVSFAETDDGRYLITLAGLCRFDAVEEIDSTSGYRRFLVNWSRFKTDMDECGKCDIDRRRFNVLLQRYFEKQDLSVNLDAIETTPDERLVTSLAMICPFEPCEKQALLEASTLAERARIMMTLLEMAVMDQAEPDLLRH